MILTIENKVLMKTLELLLDRRKIQLSNKEIYNCEERHGPKIAPLQK